MPALLWGVAFANIVRGVPIDADGNFTGTLFTLLNPFGLLGGLATVALFCTYGAIFVALKTVGPIRQDARALAARIGVVAVVLGAVFLVWSLLVHGDGVSWALAVVTAVLWSPAWWPTPREREGGRSAWSAAAVIGLVATLFVALYPDVMPSSTDPAFSLTIENASSTPSTLAVMSWVALCTLPFVLAYQAWTYWVFRKRIGRAASRPGCSTALDLRRPVVTRPATTARRGPSTRGCSGTAGPAARSCWPACCSGWSARRRCSPRRRCWRARSPRCSSTARTSPRSAPTSGCSPGWWRCAPRSPSPRRPLAARASATVKSQLRSALLRRQSRSARRGGPAGAPASSRSSPPAGSTLSTPTSPATCRSWCSPAWCPRCS